MSDRTPEGRKGLLGLTVSGVSVLGSREGKEEWLYVDDRGCDRGCLHKGPGNRDDRIRVWL